MQKKYNIDYCGPFWKWIFLWIHRKTISNMAKFESIPKLVSADQI